MAEAPSNPPEEDWLAALGVSIPDEAKRAPPKPTRFTEWREAQATKFVLGGYLARMVRVTCETCDSTHEENPQIFIEEVVVGNPTARRLTALAPNGQWPAAGPHRIEVIPVKARVCPACVRDLGFSLEVPGTFGITLEEGKGLVKK